MQSIITWRNLFNMEQLLQSADFLCIVNQHRRNKGYTAELSNLPTVYTEDSSDAIFDIIDCKQGETIIQQQGNGTAHYFNSQQDPIRNMRFIAYENFINHLPNDYNNGWSRADYIAYDTSGGKSYFIIHELSEGKLNNKRSKGLIQLQNTLMRLRECKSIEKFMDSFQNRWCILSATEGAQQAPLDMTAGFNNIYREIPDPKPLKATIITNRGFTAWETINVKL